MEFIVVVLCMLWLLVGFVVCIVWACEKDTDGWEMCNPYWSYRYHEGVNVLGAILLSLLYTILCPIGAVCYWFYKLCTVGRR